jgi:anti-anti-sigma regulatory factor
MILLSPASDIITLPPILADEHVDEIRNALLPRARACDGDEVIIDGAAVRVVSAAGLGVLVAAALVAQVHRGTLVVCGASEDLARAIGAVRGHPIRLDYLVAGERL